jgi:hypothetical protein
MMDGLQQRGREGEEGGGLDVMMRDSDESSGSVFVTQQTQHSDIIQYYRTDFRLHFSPSQLRGTMNTPSSLRS